MDDRITDEIDHLLYCNPLDNIREMHVTRTIDSPHPADTYNLLDGIPVDEDNTRCQLVGRFPFYLGLIQALRSAVVIQSEASSASANLANYSQH